METNTILVWNRRDFRLEDNPSIYFASQKGEVVPFFIFDEEREKASIGAASHWWLNHSLSSYSEALSKFGSKLILRRGDTIQAIKELVAEVGASAVYWNQCFESKVLSLEFQLKRELNKLGVSYEVFPSSYLFDPKRILNQKGKPFKVFTSYWKKCLLENVREPLPKPEKIKIYKKTIFSEKLEDFPLLPSISWDSEFYEVWSPGEITAQEKWKSFQTKIEEYGEERDYPDQEGCSHLSPHLHFGEISPQSLWADSKQLFNERIPFLRQLGWREFANYLLYHFPDMPIHPFRKNFERFQWRSSAKDLKAWQQGYTGYPFVDAGMRQLWRIGWMHNRMRLIVGSFLVKHLLISWREGEKWFWDTLVDADLANNSLGWQWISGCGVDAAPYFRIFNPITQGEKFDKEGNYIKKWVPELAKLPYPWFHRPWEAPEEVLKKANIKLGVNYPYPIVEHKFARERALKAFFEIKSDESDEIFDQ